MTQPDKDDTCRKLKRRTARMGRRSLTTQQQTICDAIVILSLIAATLAVALVCLSVVV